MLTHLSTQMADAVDAAARSVVQVQGRRRPASGVVSADGLVVTTMRALGQEDGLHVRRADGTVLEAEFAGWDPATTLAVLRVPGLDTPPIALAEAAPRVGQLALAVARSWSGAVTASAGIVAIVGGPLRTGRRRSIEQIIRTTAPLHDGFSGGAFLDTEGRLLGITTASTIRGLAIVIPAPIAWQAASGVVGRADTPRGYLGIVGQHVALPAHQQPDAERDRGLLVVGVAADSPAAHAGILVGDLLLALGERAVTSPEDVLDAVCALAPGRAVDVHLLRGGAPVHVSATIGARPHDARA